MYIYMQIYAYFLCVCRFRNTCIRTYIFFAFFVMSNYLAPGRDELIIRLLLIRSCEGAPRVREHGFHERVVAGEQQRTHASTCTVLSIDRYSNSNWRENFFENIVFETGW